jgi:hypothetical protein
LKDLPVGSVVAKVQAMIPNQYNSTLSYSFLRDGLLSNELFEFEIKNTFSGQIFLKRKLNVTVSTIREVEKYFILVFWSLFWSQI